MIVKRGKGDFNQAYRPCRISEVYGQDSIVQVIKNGLDSGDLPNKLLISGPIGAGKTTFSRIIGMGLLCENEPTSNPCCQCEVCKSIIKRGSDIAYREYNPSELSRKKDRDDLNLRISRSAVNRKRQIFVFNECHKLHDNLKTPLSMEYPPEYYMIFCSTKPESVDDRIKEGCKIFELEKYSPTDLSRLLRDVCKSENIKPKKKIIDSIVSKAGDNIRSAIMHLKTAISDGSLEKDRKKQVIKEREPNKSVDFLSEAAVGSKRNDMPTDQPQPPGKMEGRTNATKDIDIIKGKKNPHILLIAPHAPIIGKKSLNDRNTGIIAEQVQNTLKCSAIINSVYRKPSKNGKPDLKNKRLDLNIIEHAKLHPTFLDDIKKMIDFGHKTLVVWIHGMADSSAKYESNLKSNGFNGNPNALHALIGYGQGPNPNVASNKRNTEDEKSRHSATKETVEKFKDLLTKNGLTTILTRENASNFRGRDPKRMNQWFKNEGYELSGVESIQLEIREQDFRDSRQHCQDTAKKIAKALQPFIEAENLPAISQNSADNSDRRILLAKDLNALIRTCNDFGQLKDIKDKAEALRVYARTAKKSFEMQNEYAEVKIRAERRCGQIIPPMIQHGGDRKSKSRFNGKTLKDLGVSKNQSHRWQIIAQLDEKEFEGFIAQVKDSKEELTSAGVFRFANKKLNQKNDESKPVPGAESIKTPISIKTITGDFMNYIDQFDNIDAIITDPPYPKKYLHLYENLARFASKILKPGGSLLTMAGVYYLPQVFELMTPHLNYHWTISYHMPRRPRREWQRKILNTWKPILWFVKDKYEGEWNKDVLEAGAIEKTFHPWQQTVADFEAFIEMVSKPGETIIDPFFGSGSLGEAAVKLKREFVGIEIEPNTMQTAEKRLENFAKKIVLPSYFPNEEPAEVLENWKKNNDASGIKSTPQSDQNGVFHIKLAGQKPKQPKDSTA